MRWIKVIAGVLGVLGVLLGGLWFLQGTGLVVIEPIACVGECAPLEGPSLPWAVGGLLLMVVAGGLLWFAFKRR